MQTEFARAQMITQQVRAWDVLDERVLDAMRRTPREFFVPGFLERDEGERERPYVKYPWDGVSGVRPFHELAEATTVGVY